MKHYEIELHFGNPVETFRKGELLYSMCKTCVDSYLENIGNEL